MSLFFYIILIGFVFFGGLMLSNNDNSRLKIVGKIILTIISGVTIYFILTVDEKTKKTSEHENTNEVLECEILNVNCPPTDTLFVIDNCGNIVGSFIKK